jgi:hypothetical protein
MTDEDIAALAEQCRVSDARRILVTHGTSTMVRSARAIAQALDGGTVGAPAIATPTSTTSTTHAADHVNECEDKGGGHHGAATTSDKVVVITGSLLPRVFTETDADFNLGVAVGALGALSPGVYVAMSGVVYPYDQVARDPHDGSFVPHTTPGCVAADDPGIAVTLAALHAGSRADFTHADYEASPTKRPRVYNREDDTIGNTDAV